MRMPFFDMLDMIFFVFCLKTEFSLVSSIQEVRADVTANALRPATMHTGLLVFVSRVDWPRPIRHMKLEEIGMRKFCEKQLGQRGRPS